MDLWTFFQDLQGAQGIRKASGILPDFKLKTVVWCWPCGAVLGSNMKAKNTERWTFDVLHYEKEELRFHPPIHLFNKYKAWTYYVTHDVTDTSKRTIVD